MKLTNIELYVNLNLFQVLQRISTQYDEILKQVKNEDVHKPISTII